jgi:hypothetical protein
LGDKKPKEIFHEQEAVSNQYYSSPEFMSQKYSFTTDIWFDIDSIMSHETKKTNSDFIIDKNFKDFIFSIKFSVIKVSYVAI